MKPILIISAVAVAILGLGTLLLRQSQLGKAADPLGLEETEIASEENFLRLTPPEVSSDGIPIAKMSAAEAEKVAAGFFARPTLTDADLAALQPFTDTKNVPSRSCQSWSPQGVSDELINGAPSRERRMKGEIYFRLNLLNVLDRQDCSCAGKNSAWEPVEPILAEFIHRNGAPEPVDADVMAEGSRRLKRAVEHLCQGDY